MFLVGVETVGGLVEDQHLRVVQDRLGETDTTLEALGERLDALVKDIPQFQPVHRLQHALLRVLAAKAADFGDEAQEASDAHVAVERRALRQVADLALCLQRVPGDIAAANHRGAAGRRQESGHHLHGGGLARTIGAQEPQHLAGLHREADAVHGGEISKLLGQ